MNNSIVKTTILVVSLLISSLKSDAQSFSALNSHLQKVRIGLVDEFFDRFNGKTSHPDLPITNDESRINNLLMLYNLSQFTSKDDPRFNEAREMMNVVISDSIGISFSDTTWAAIAHCKGSLDGKSVKFDLFLTVQHRNQNMYKWVISRAEGDFLKITPRNDNEKIMLNPDDHETNFISLKRMTCEQPFNVRNFMSNGFEYDITSVFTYLVYSKKLKIDYVDELEFVFTQIPGYIFHVQYFEREKTNAGWLISNFYKSNTDNKNAFLRLLHPQYTDPLFASQQIVDNDIHTSKEPLDTTKVENKVDFKEMFLKRHLEKLGQLCDYISFMQKKDTVRSQSVYKNKLIGLFAENSKITLQYNKKSKNKTVSVADFCQMLIQKSITFVGIDSICLPVWDDKINSLSQETNKVELSTSQCLFKSIKESDVSTCPNYDQVLYAYKEETEDGIEWIPVFGDMIVKVK